MDNKDIENKIIQELSGSSINNEDPVTFIKYSRSRAELINSPVNYKISTTNPKIKKLSKTKYVNTETGEIKKYKQHKKRTKSSFNHTFKNLKEKIYCNFFGDKNELFATLTFDNLAAPIDLRFNKDNKHNKQVGKYCQKKLTALLQRLSRKYDDKDKHYKLIHIIIMEAQKSGVPHYHLLLKLLNADALRLTQGDLNELWGQGEVHTEPLNDVTNLPKYFHARLTDLPCDEATKQDKENYETIERSSNGQSKSFLKGARLQYFPADINYFSSSKNLKSSDKQQMTAYRARHKAKELGLMVAKGLKYRAYSIDGRDEWVKRESWTKHPSPQINTK